MSKFRYTKFEKQMNSVLKHQDKALADIHFPSSDEADATIARTEDLLRSLGYQPEELDKLVPIHQPKKVMVVPTWEELCVEAERHVGTGCELESIFTEEELRSNELAIRQLNEEFNVIHRLDAFDISIAALAGLVGAAVDILLVGVPTKTPEGLKGGGHLQTMYGTILTKSSPKKKCRNSQTRRSARFRMMPRITGTPPSK